MVRGERPAWNSLSPEQFRAPDLPAVMARSKGSRVKGAPCQEDPTLETETPRPAPTRGAFTSSHEEAGPTPRVPGVLWPPTSYVQGGEPEHNNLIPFSLYFGNYHSFLSWGACSP